jgi:hypothetical protein
MKLTIIGIICAALCTLTDAFMPSSRPSLLMQHSSEARHQRHPTQISEQPTSEQEISITNESNAAVITNPSPSLEGNPVVVRLLAELQEVGDSISISYNYLSQPIQDVSPEDIVKICDAIDAQLQVVERKDEQLIMDTIGLKIKALELGRYHSLVKLMKKDYDSYVATSAFLSPSRIDRGDLPNLQDVPFNDIMPSIALKDDVTDELVEDCTLEELQFNDSILDKVLLYIFRNLVEKNTGGVSSSKKGIDGLLDQGRTFMLQSNQTAEAQHKMVSDTLGGLMTAVLPPFYRIFMSGIVPKLGTDFDGKQIGPWFYAPWLTTIVTPTFFGFLVGPSKPNRRKDGGRGGLVVEKCKFLQESGCKGLCLHQCKIPAQQFFKNELGLELSVSPNFATQECQWSFGETPLPPNEDPSFPSGCLKGCESRAAMVYSPADSAMSCSS